MKIVSVRKKQRGKLPKDSPDIYTASIEFTEEELQTLTDNMVVEVDGGATEDLISHAISRLAPTEVTFTKSSFFKL